jgi:hypothetical protein
MRLIRNSGKGGWLDVGKLGFGRKAANPHIRMDSSAVSFPLSYSSSLVAPDLTLSIFWLREMPAALMSIGLEPSYRREPTDTTAILKSLRQAREQPSRKLPSIAGLLPIEHDDRVVSHRCPRRSAFPKHVPKVGGRADIPAAGMTSAHFAMSASRLKRIPGRGGGEFQISNVGAEP